MDGGKQRFEKNVDIVFGLLPPLSGDGDNPSFVNTSFFTCLLKKDHGNADKQLCLKTWLKIVEEKIKV